MRGISRYMVYRVAGALAVAAAFGVLRWLGIA